MRQESGALRVMLSVRIVRQGNGAQRRLLLVRIVRQGNGAQRGLALAIVAMIVRQGNGVREGPPSVASVQQVISQFFSVSQSWTFTKYSGKIKKAGVIYQD